MVFYRAFSSRWVSVLVPVRVYGDQLSGYTYNFMVMFGMLLGLGMLIDGAIVVVELADRRMVEGYPPREAYIYSIRRMFWPVVASTGTTLAAFLPLMFWPGVTGAFMMYLPVTVFAVLAGSLLYALLFAPVLGAIIGRQRERSEAGSSFQLIDEGHFEKVGGIMGIYTRILLFTTRHPLVVIAIAFVTLYAIVRLYSVAGNGMQFFTDVDPTFSQVVVSAKGNYSARELRDIVKDVESRILEQGRIGSIYTRTGGGGVSGGSGGTTADRIGSMFIELSDRRTREDSGTEVLEDWRHAVEDVPGVRVEVQEMEQGPPVGKEIQIQLSGIELDLLAKETLKVRGHLESMGGLIDVDDTAPVPGIEWEVKVDRAKAAMLGADIAGVGAAIQLVTNGVLVGRYRPDDVDDEVDIRVRFPEESRSISALDNLRVTTRQGQVPISSFVEREAKPKISTIFRQDGKRIMYVRAEHRTGRTGRRQGSGYPPVDGRGGKH
ncbi:MAG: efflux RND transporter permease subunit [Gammaproteobacteria bacterium]|nr:efflux RND transporter permease subunit [Gammaproteobacteria bacterium]